MEAFKDPLVFTAACALIGLFVGSFLNVVIHRLPLMMEREWQAEAAALRGEEPSPQAQRFNLATLARAAPIAAIQSAPSRTCPFSAICCSGGAVAIAAGRSASAIHSSSSSAQLLSGFTAWHFGFGMAGAAALLFLWALIALCFIDLDTQLLPDSITLPLLWAGLLLNLSGTFTDISSAVVGAAAGYLTLWSVFWLFKLTTGKEGMGYGDFKLLAAIGAWLGWQILPLTILLSSLVGAIVGIALIVFRRHGREIPIPFGPYLAAAGLLALYWGPSLTQAYLGML
jgi:leader peptidase (prepilin peptidase)/N-methyltransferase